MVEVKCLVTLQKDLLGSEITVTNPRPTSLQLLGYVVSHLTVSTPDATYAIGLQGSSYHNKQPMVSDFSIIPPDSRGENSLSPLARKGFDALFSGWEKRGQVRDEEMTEDGEEDNDYAQMTEKMCRIYTSAPREFTIMDRVTISYQILKQHLFAYDKLHCVTYHACVLPPPSAYLKSCQKFSLIKGKNKKDKQPLKHCNRS